jgi:DNA-binding response OmpR family regulator
MMAPPALQDLAGLKILVVEDNYLLAMETCRILRSHGGEVLGPVARVKAALDLLETGPSPDCAVLDVNLHGEYCFPIARLLASRDVPFVFLTGYDDRRIIPPDLHAAPMLGKPMDERDLIAAIAPNACRG